MRTTKILFILSIFFISTLVSSEIQNTKVTPLTDQDYSDIWLGISTGGYKLIAEKNKPYTFEIFIKNGMAENSLHNIELSPRNFPFEITRITPNSIEQLKPMEIRFFTLNISIPEDTSPGKYPITFDVSSDEFPKNVFELQEEIEVVDRIKNEVYIIYTIIAISILSWLFYRKFKQKK